MKGSTHLTFDQHGHVGKHFTEFFNTGFELNDVFVSSFDIRECLLGLLGVGYDLKIIKLRSLSPDR
jgi:hypothetical protein